MLFSVFSFNSLLKLQHQLAPPTHMAINEKTFWLETVEIPTPVAREFPQRIDVAVIGAGVSGSGA